MENEPSKKYRTYFYLGLTLNPSSHTAETNNVLLNEEKAESSSPIVTVGSSLREPMNSMNGDGVSQQAQDGEVPPSSENSSEKI